MVKEYHSNQEFFEDINRFQHELSNSGHENLVNDIQKGLGCINGLTDGWALFMKSLEGIADKYSSELSDANKQQLSEFLEITKKIVFRE